jgi:hypothetical protein
LRCIHIQINDWLEALFKQITEELPASSLWNMTAVWKCPVDSITAIKDIAWGMDKACMGRQLSTGSQSAAFRTARKTSCGRRVMDAVTNKEAVIMLDMD